MTFHMSHRRENANGDPRLRTEKEGAEHVGGSGCLGSAVSNAQKAIIQGAYGLPGEKVAVVPNGVDTTVFSPDASGNTGVLDRYGIRKPYALFCGRPVKEKGPETLLRALPYLARGRPGMNAVFMFLGRPEHHGNQRFWDTHDSGEFRSYRQNVIFPATGTGIGGFISDEDRAAIYANAEVGVLPSNPALAPEAFGLTGVECQACGRPVVVGKGTGMEETIMDGTTGIAADPADPKSIADAALACMGSPAMGPAARQLMEEHFRWDAPDGPVSRYRRLFDSL